MTWKGPANPLDALLSEEGLALPLLCCTRSVYLTASIFRILLRFSAVVLLFSTGAYCEFSFAVVKVEHPRNFWTFTLIQILLVYHRGLGHLRTLEQTSFLTCVRL